MHEIHPVSPILDPTDDPFRSNTILMFSSYMLGIWWPHVPAGGEFIDGKEQKWDWGYKKMHVTV